MNIFKQKSEQGFIILQIILGILFVTLVLSGVTYLGIKQSNNDKFEKVEKERVQQEKEYDTQLKFDEQQKALEDAQKKIEELSTQTDATQKKQDTLEKTIKSEAQKPQLQPQNTSVISSTELAGYLTGIVRLVCWTSNSNGTTDDKVSGSGSLWSFDSSSKKYVLTNKHVAIGNQCIVNADDTNGKLINMFEAKVVAGFIQNDKDFALLEIANIEDNGFSDVKTTGLNYKLPNLRFCPTQVILGSPVAIIGYPASTQTESNVFVPGMGSQTVSNTPRTVTSGIISAYDNTANNPYTGGLSQHQNYYISAKIDSGNSGGIALSKDTNGLCVLGIPTWLNVGNYDTQGLIQNIHNVISR